MGPLELVTPHIFRNFTIIIKSTSLNDSDEPYWPQFNCACYKEVWVTSAGKWLSLVAETEN